MEKIVGVISDIHSNYTAFKTVVDLMLNRGIKDFLLLGDYVSDTVETEATMKLLYELIDKYNVICLRGNREDYMINQRKTLRGEEKDSENLGEKWCKNSASGNLLYTYERLTDKDIDFFESLPLSLVYNEPGLPSITIAHGSPDNTRELLEFDWDNTKEWLKKIDTAYLLCAHTHYPGTLSLNEKTYFNSGCVGIAIKDHGLAQCMILHGHYAAFSSPAYWEPEFLKVPYDVDSVISKIFSEGLFNYAPWFLSANLHILRTGIDKCPELINHASNLEAKKTGRPTVWPHISEESFQEAAAFLNIPYGTP